jgi:hypothetical protein
MPEHLIEPGIEFEDLWTRDHQRQYDRLSALGHLRTREESLERIRLRAMWVGLHDLIKKERENNASG